MKALQHGSAIDGRASAASAPAGWLLVQDRINPQTKYSATFTAQRIRGADSSSITFTA